MPMSLLALGASIEGLQDYEIIDGNLINDSETEQVLAQKIEETDVLFFGITVMPGPQLWQSVPLTKFLKTKFPDLKIIWGGYFPTLHFKTVLESGYIDFVMKGQADFGFPQLVEFFQGKRKITEVTGLSYIENGKIIENPPNTPTHPDDHKRFPYRKVQMQKYLNPTILGKKTTAFHASVGCPFTCSFCAVAAIYEGKWIPMSSEKLIEEILFLKKEYEIDSVEFHDNNFFTTHKRVEEFALGMKNQNITWWGEGRIDTLLEKYPESAWKSMSENGCKMIFLGAESGSEKVLDIMGKGGTQRPKDSIDLAKMMKGYGIIPEFSFVLGNPIDPDDDIRETIELIKKIKKVNPKSEIILYTYSPVPYPGTELYDLAVEKGFRYPQRLEDWVSDFWINFDLRKNPMTPWLKSHHIDKIRNFEYVLNAYYPTQTYLPLTEFQKKILRFLGSWRYKYSFYNFPMELRILMNRVFKYRSPEIEGF